MFKEGASSRYSKRRSRRLHFSDRPQASPVMLRGPPSNPHFFRKLRQKMNYVSFLPKTAFILNLATFIPKLSMFVTNLSSCPYFVKKSSPKYEKPYLCAACITRFDTHIVSNSHQHQAVIAPHAGRGLKHYHRLRWWSDYRVAPRAMACHQPSMHLNPQVI
jgi:hypothetical protein